MKTHIMKSFWAILSVCILLSFIGCRSDGSASGGSNDEASSADFAVHGRAFHFVSDEAKQEWKEPLAKLLSNVLMPYSEHGEILGYEATIDPHAPAIPQCYQCGLLDVTLDGVPELLVYPFGYFGSSGTATYYVYDIYTGQRLGDINGGYDQSWCVYYDMEYDTLELVGQYWLRGGWAWRDRYITEVTYIEATMECFEMQRFRTSHEIAGEQRDIVDDNPDDGYYTATWVESYPDTTYYLNSQKVYLDDYYAMYNHFIRMYIRIPQTELIMISWSDISDDGDDYTTKGAKMAEALVRSEQEFVLP